MSDMFFDFESAINKVCLDNIPHEGKEYERLCSRVYSKYPDFRNKWMERLGYDRKPWTEKFAYYKEDMDGFYMFRKQYEYFLSWVQECIKAQEDLKLLDRRAMKIRMTHAVGELIIPGYERHPQQIDCAEMSCAVDFFWEYDIKEDPTLSKEEYRFAFDNLLYSYYRSNSVELASEDIGKMLSHKKWYEERVCMTPEEKEKALRLIKEQKEEDRRREFVWKAYRERHPLTNMSDLL